MIIRVVSPAGPVTERDLDAGVSFLRAEGHEVSEAPHCRARAGYLAGGDAERLSDLQAALDDRGAEVVWFARGGFGTQRLITRLRLPAGGCPPKVLAGYSDATALFLKAQGHPSLRLLYAPSVQELGRPGACDLSSLRAALAGRPESLAGLGCPTPAGPAEVVGGCLSLLVTSCGTPWQPETSGKFLFLEDTGEPLYRIDRMLTHLAHAGWFEAPSGLLLGPFTRLGEGEREEQVAGRVRELLPPRTPVITGLNVGHRQGKQTLPLGREAYWDGRALRFC